MADNVIEVVKSPSGGHRIDLRTIPSPLCGHWIADLSSFSSRNTQHTLVLGTGPIEVMVLVIGDGRNKWYEDADEAIADGNKMGSILFFPNTPRAEVYSVTRVMYFEETTLLKIIGEQRPWPSDPTRPREIEINVLLSTAKSDSPKTGFSISTSEGLDIWFSAKGTFSPLVADLSEVPALLESQRKRYDPE